MPMKPSYCRDLPNGISQLRSLETDWVDRRQVESVLGVSKSVAWRLMRHCGAVRGPGNTLVCRRLELIARFEDLLNDGGTVDYEVQRRQRLEEYIARIRPQVRANRIKVVPNERVLELVNSRFSSLPPNVSLTPQTLHIEFHGTEDFLSAIGTVIYALNNDFDAISLLIERK